MDIIEPPMTAAIIPAKVPAKSTISRAEEAMSTAISKAKTRLMLNLNNKKRIANAENIPAIK